MKRFILFLALFLELNVCSQAQEKPFQSILCDSIRKTALTDIEKHIYQIGQCLEKNLMDSANVTYYRESVMISFNAEEYSEITAGYLTEGCEIKEKILKMETAQRLKKIDKAINQENKILHELFDCFIYKCVFKYEENHGWEAEHKIKVDDDGMKIIGRNISVILISD